jgi:hypothetical protein
MAYADKLSRALARSRSDATTDLLMGAGFLVLNVLILHAHGWILYAISAVLGLQTLFAIRRRYNLRAGSPIVTALGDPTTLARVRGWPYLRQNPGKQVPAFVVALAQTGASVRLKLPEPELRAFIAELAEEAPKLEIDVSNVLVQNRAA